MNIFGSPKFNHMSSSFFVGEQSHPLDDLEATIKGDINKCGKETAWAN